MDSDSNEQLAEQIYHDFFEARGELLKADGLSGHYVPTFLDFAFNYEGVEFPEFSEADVEYVLFDLMPRKFSVDSDRAPFIVAELRIFFEYVKEKFKPHPVDSVLSMLNEADIAKQLQEALADTSRFGLAKSLLMSAKNMGYDVTDPEEMNEFVALHNEQMAQQYAQKISNPTRDQFITRMDSGHQPQPSPPKSPMRSPAEQRKFNKERQKTLAKKKRK